MFLRVPDRGAVGVFAASWRNSPSRGFSQALIDGLTEPGNPVGIAIMDAKQQTQNRTLVETYNLLGDPAIALALPEQRIEVEVASSGQTPVVSGRLSSPGFNGEGAVEWLGDSLEVLHRQPVVVIDAAFELAVEPAAVELVTNAFALRAWAVDRTNAAEGIGFKQLREPGPNDESAPAAGPPAVARAEVEAEQGSHEEAGGGKGR
jgi:hypothetical protein